MNFFRVENLRIVNIINYWASSCTPPPALLFFPAHRSPPSTLSSKSGTFAWGRRTSVTVTTSTCPPACRSPPVLHHPNTPAGFMARSAKSTCLFARHPLTQCTEAQYRLLSQTLLQRWWSPENWRTGGLLVSQPECLTMDSYCFFPQ